MRRVIIESPFAGDVASNISYARRAMADCLRRGEAPFAGHALYTQEGVLDDSKPDERRLGMEAGFTWGECADACVVYLDRGLSNGMKEGIARARALKIPVEERYLDRSQEAS